MNSTGSEETGAGRMICRRAYFVSRKWTRKEEEPKYAPDRTCDVEHLRLELEVDLPGRAIDAVCTQRLRASYGPFDAITLDSFDLQIRSVRDGAGRDLSYTEHGRKLAVRFPEPVADTVDLVISYHVQDPVDGLFFQGPVPWDPDAARQLWSQGEDEGARHWIPCHDAPNERMTTEMIVKVPAECTVISNGKLLGVTGSGNRKTWHYLESVPHPSYLISLVVGVFSRLDDQWNGIPVEYFVEPGREDEGRRSFGRTPDMIEFFSRQLDTPYPYEKYAQVAVRHFHFGGMENTSATTQTDGTLHDERAALDFTSDELVAHELAHQWFGDLVTCKTWAHAWLNEGFATYFEALWKEWDKGREEFDYEMIQNAASYMAEPYRRPIVTARYGHPFEMFDMHLYPKGGWVLHMLRRELGDDLFWKALRLYLKRHAPGPVETIDLIRAFEDASGRNLTGFFDQWVYAPGHPELEGEISWDQENGWVKVALKQAHKRENGVPVFKLPIRVEARLSGGGIEVATFRMEREDHTFYLPVPEKPASVVLDPEGALLCETRIKRSQEWLEAALLGPVRDDRVAVRVEVVRQMAEEASPRSVRALGRVLLEDPFWGVQAEAAQALGRIRTPGALQALRAAIEVENPKARRAVVAALGNWHEAEAVASLRRIVAEGDASYFVQMTAAAALGRAGREEAAAGLRTELRDALGRRDWHDVIATGAIEGLSAARDEDSVEDLIAAASDRSRYWSMRLAALRGLGEIGAARPLLAHRIAEALIPFLEDTEYLVAARTPSALVRLGDPSGIASLRRKGETTPKPEMREACLLAADQLAAMVRPGEDVDRLRQDLEKLREEARAMKETLESMKQKVMPGTGSPNGGGSKSPQAGPRTNARSRPAAGTAKRTPARTAGKAAKAAKAAKPAKPAKPSGRKSSPVRKAAARPRKKR